MVVKARDATFLHTGAGTWVGKLAYLTTNPLKIKRVKGPWLKLYQIIELRQGDLDIPVWIHQFNSPSSSIPLGVPLKKTHLQMAVLTIQHHPIGPQGPGSVIGIRETKGLNHLGFLHLPQTVVLRVIGVHYQQHLWCHPDLTSQTDQGIPDEVDNTKKKHTWK